MSNKVLLKKSSVVSKVPATTDLDYGELALNYADGLLYFKNANNQIQSFSSSTSSFVTLTGTQTLTNKTLTSPTINGAALSGTLSGNITLSGTVNFTGSETLISSGSGGNEGGELHFAVPSTGTTLSGPIAIDIYQNKIRFFETGGTNRGAYIDFSSASAGVGSNLLSGGGASLPSQTGNSGKYLTTDGTNASWATISSYTLPTASTTTLGGVKVDGTSITIDGNGVISSGGGSGNSFTTIAVSGQSSVLADSSTDTLTLVAGGVLSITTNATTDTITIGTAASFFPFIKYDGNASNIPLYTEMTTLQNSLDTVFLPFIKSDGSSVTTLKLTA